MMQKNWVVAEYNFADTRWATGLFNADDKIRNVNTSKYHRNIRKAVSVSRHFVVDENGVNYQRFSDNSLKAIGE